MKGENGERWRILCERAAMEQDPDRLVQLTQEISCLLDEKEERLKKTGVTVLSTRFFKLAAPCEFLWSGA